MIEKDYIMRIFQQFFLFLNNLLGNLQDGNNEEARLQLQDLYETYFEKSYLYYYNISLHELLDYVKSEKIYLQIERVEMLSELYYNDGMLSNDKDIKNNLLNKALILYNYVEEINKSLSLERIEKKNKINEVLEIKGESQ